MFEKISVPFNSVMLFNELSLKPGISVSDVELAIGELCNVVKNNYGNDEGGFLAGQVYENSGFLSAEGSFENEGLAKEERGDIVLVTFWRSFDQHEKSHADKLFKDKFSDLLESCDSTRELGYKLLWQGEPEGEKNES